MWQLLLGAAIAGSTGVLAKHLFNPKSISQDSSNTNFDTEKQDPRLQNRYLEPGCESNWDEKPKQGEIFRFSSSESAVKTKTGVKARKKVVLKKAEKRSNGGSGVEVNTKKFSVCLKKRRTAKNEAYKCGAFPSKGMILFIYQLSSFCTVILLSCSECQTWKSERCLYVAKSMSRPLAVYITCKHGYGTNRFSVHHLILKVGEKWGAGGVGFVNILLKDCSFGKEIPDLIIDTIESDEQGSVFRWGLGFGIMYMMSAGRAEIGKLNSAMDETAKVVQELKTTLCKRKSSCNLHASSSASEVAASSKKFSGKNSQLLLRKSGTGNRDHNETKVCSLPVFDDGEYASSVLTEEPEPELEVVEMDQLEAELELELQKLSETEVSAKSLHEPVGERFDSYQSKGVLPSELDQKLCHVLIEQQENQIEELESELNSAQSKLREKEAELQALKDCVKRLTNFSLSTGSDDDTEAQGDQECMKDQDSSIKSGSETRKSLVGMKRHMEF
ncbi:hypothetical protein Golax_009480 [Gossypium laxum]|uniref:Uncharacterized protein n=1 Tax=Gossypium laxum TaxID=34288 RepID=A0A7J9ADA9_9ROSI|nr:hypothetical protein [Gossypium laxum]